jgi:hypothetical protein
MILKDSWRVWPWPAWWALSVSWATLQSKQLFFSLHCLPPDFCAVFFWNPKGMAGCVAADHSCMAWNVALVLPFSPWQKKNCANQYVLAVQSHGTLS